MSANAVPTKVIVAAVKEWKRVLRVMEKEKICSEHGARCFIEATRRDNARSRKIKPRTDEREGK